MNKYKILVGSLLLSSPALVFAISAGGIAEGIGSQASTATIAAVLVGALVGIVFLIMGGMGFKKYADNPQQTPLSKPMIFLAAGALLFGLSATSDTLQETIFGDTRNSTTGVGATGAPSDF